jgi:hypothetical protein
MGPSLARRLLRLDRPAVPDDFAAAGAVMGILFCQLQPTNAGSRPRFHLFAGSCGSSVPWSLTMRQSRRVGRARFHPSRQCVSAVAARALGSARYWLGDLFPNGVIFRG